MMERYLDWLRVWLPIPFRDAAKMRQHAERQAARHLYDANEGAPHRCCAHWFRTPRGLMTVQFTFSHLIEAAGSPASETGRNLRGQREHCYRHLSLSFPRNALGRASSNDAKREMDTVAREFFGDALPWCQHLTGLSRAGQVLGVRHWMAACDENWQPTLPNDERTQAFARLMMGDA